MSSNRHYCSTCHSWYRGLGGIHDSTAKHRANIRRRESAGTSSKGLNRHQGQRSGRRAPQGSDMVSVVDYYRNPPTPPWAASITDRVFYVNHYWRREPYVAHRRAAGRVLKHHSRKFKAQVAAIRKGLAR